MSFIKEQQEEAHRQLFHKDEFSGVTFVRPITKDRIDSLISQVVQNTLNKALELVDKHDPNVGMGRETNKAFWGNTLRTDIQSLLKDITNKDNLK